MELHDAFFALLRAELTGAPLPENTFADVDEATLSSLYDFAEHQEVAQLLAEPLERAGVLKCFPAFAERCYRRQAVAAYHAEQQKQVFALISEAFDKAALPYLPLKGLVIRALYPEPWMRTAGDIDVLIKKEDLERASDLLLGLGARREDKKENHDRAFHFATGVMLELHYCLIASNNANRAKDALDEIWEHTERVAENRFEYRMEDAWFYYYHLVHAAKHLEDGSCGARPFLDLWFLNHKVAFDADARREILEQNRLLPFADAAVSLSEAWLSGRPKDEWTESLEHLLLSGGIFGDKATKFAAATNKKGGKFRFYLTRIFLPYGKMKKRAPVLERHPWLFPFLQVTRWFSFLFRGGVRRNRGLSNEAAETTGTHTTKELLEHLGL